MDLLREWRRRLYGAAAGAILAPLAIIAAAAAVGFGGGGIAGIGSLGQAFSGPELPDVAPVSQRRGARDTERLLAQVRDAAAPATATTAPTAGGTTGGETVAGVPPSQTTAPTDDGVDLPGGSFDPGGNTTPSADPDTPTATQPPVVTAAPTVAPAPTSPARQLGDTVKQITDDVPVVGEPAGQVVDGVVDTVDTVLPPR